MSCFIHVYTSQVNYGVTLDNSSQCCTISLILGRSRGSTRSILPINSITSADSIRSFTSLTEGSDETETLAVPALFCWRRFPLPDAVGSLTVEDGTW
jgi:hypothetical protein